MRHGSVLCLWLVLVAPRPAGAQAARVEPYRDPNLAAIKSLAAPGWGQFDNEQPQKGTALIVTAAVGLLFATDTVSLASGGSGADLEHALGWLGYGVSAVVGAYDAYVNAERLDRENGYRLDEAARGRSGGDKSVRLVLFQRRF